MSTKSARCLCAAAAFAALASAQQASAYCRSNTCKVSDLCLQDDLPVGYCKPLRWRGSCIGFSIQEDASSEISYQEISDVLDAAFRTWQEAPCDGGTPGFRVQNLGPVSCGAVELNARDGKTRVVDGLVPGNANVVAFRDLDWLAAAGHRSEMLALTTVQFDKNTGDLWGADMEINTHLYDFTVDDDSAAPREDLLAIVTHEAGHFLGLDHSQAGPEATMHERYDRSDPMNFRTLHADDIAGICQIYPPRDLSTSECNPIPPHGFSPECAADQQITCGMAPPAARRPGSGSGWLAALAAVAIGAAARLRAGARGRREEPRRGRSAGGPGAAPPGPRRESA
ncbi:matrixin family metalloprotease [Sorangium sp. So ce590]|uniref:matrixin family metalloprotease n=1 Tax=Sorangium sp. So ce590 TaxID=3133317 RepID=UPI003F61347C